MAKKKTRPKQHNIRGKNASRRPGHYQESVRPSTGVTTDVDTNNVPRRVAIAHAKHTASTTTPTSIPTLGDRFHALPPELRLHIFSFLLVRPVKWDLPHKDTCPLQESADDIFPRINIPNWFRHVRYREYAISFDTCIRCGSHDHYHQRAPLWQREDPPRITWRNPWRSIWAPEVTNEFMCSDCWDNNFRPEPHAEALKAQREGFLRCLCARRDNLQVLLVCRRWYEEAGRILYSSNTFAFDTAAMFVAFITHLPQQWRSLLSKVSIKFHSQHGAPDTITDPDARLDYHLTLSEPAKTLSTLWSTLRSLPSLSHLELDASYLTRTKPINALLRIGLRNVHSIRFTLQNRQHFFRNPISGGSVYIYPEHAYSRILVGGLAEEVSRSMKGHRTAWLKKAGAVEMAVQREMETLRELLRELRVPEGTRKWTWRYQDDSIRPRLKIYYDEDVKQWTKIWNEFAGGKLFHAYLPTSAIAKARKT